ncbi:MAG: sigma-54-dependent Fis family transcriptional regulator, partial [Burkholderiales bacterium PBB5]
GNIRELRNEIGRALALADGPLLQARDFSRKLLAGQTGSVQAAQATQAAQASHSAHSGNALPASGTLAERLDAIEAMLLREAMLQHRWNKTQAAKALGLSRVGLRAKLLRFGLEGKT